LDISPEKPENWVEFSLGLMRALVLLVFLAVIHSAIAASSAGRVVWDIPEAMHLIETADEVYVFQVTVTKNKKGEVEPHGDYKHARAIDAEARRKLSRLLGNDRSWCHCFDNTFGIGPEPKYVGFIFQRGKDKLVLLRFLRWHTEGTFNGENTGGSLEEKGSDKLDDWEKRYARPERGFK
jgi:hypothetical protein